MDLGTSIAITGALFSACIIVFGALTLRQASSRNALEAVNDEVESLRASLRQCREERDRLLSENFRLRRDNESLMRRILKLEDGHV